VLNKRRTERRVVPQRKAEDVEHRRNVLLLLLLALPLNWERLSLRLLTDRRAKHILLLSASLTQSGKLL
jgi:hypothetical protein